MSRKLLIAIGWGSAALLFGCPGGGGDSEDGNCPMVAGQWSVSGECSAASCTIEQDEGSCTIALDCDDGTAFSGTVSASAISFSGEAGDAGLRTSCNGTLSGLEDDDEDGFIQPELNGNCTTSEGMCSVEAACIGGDCTEAPEDEPVGGSGGQSGSESGSGGSGAGGTSGVNGAGEGGASGVNGAGQGGFAGIAGAGGASGAGAGGESGVGGDGGSSGGGSPTECAACLDSACVLGCAEVGGGCVELVACAVSNCDVTDDACIESACAAEIEATTEEGQAAAGEVQSCALLECASECTGGGGGEPITPGEGCSDECQYAGDGACDDGGPGYDFDICGLGTDCSDCGVREVVDAPVEGCSETCTYSNDGECDDGGPGFSTDICALGTDCIDCGAR